MNTLAIHWASNPELINLFGLPIRYYGIIFVSGLALSLFLLHKIFTKEHLPQVYLDKLAIWGLIGIFAGARLGHCLFYDPLYYFQNPLEMIFPIRVIEGSYRFVGYEGLASHGAAIGLLITLLLYAKNTKQSFLRVLDYIAIVTPLASAFIRIANFMNSEIIGTPTNLPWAIVFESYDSTPRHPAQLYEAIAYLAIFGITWSLYLKKRLELPKGFYFGLTTTFIFIFRFAIEFIKEKQVSFEESMLLDMGQILSIPFIIAGIFFIWYSFKKLQTPKVMSLAGSMWDSRYTTNEFIFGKEPNDYLAAVSHTIPNKGKVLSLGEGEGRNAVYLAKLGMEVRAVDASSIGLTKAQEFAKEQGVRIDTEFADLENYSITPNSYDAIISIFCHVPSPLRAQLHPQIIAGLKSGGVVIMELYSEEQITKNTGGPSNEDFLLSAEELETAFADLEIIQIQEVEREIVEGVQHSGLSSVVQLLARKK